MDKEQIIKALTEKPELIGEIIPTIQTNELVQKMVTNKAESIYQERFDGEMKKRHDQSDNDMFEILGEKPRSNDDGTKQKTYEKQKELYKELKELRDKKAELEKDPAIVELKAKIKNLEEGGGLGELKKTYEAQKESMQSQIDDLQGKLKEAETSSMNTKKESEIQKGLAEIEFAPQTPQSVKDAILATAKTQLMNSSEFNTEGTLIFKNDGKIVLNPTTHAPKTVAEMLGSMEAIKDLSIKKDKNKGGGAPTTISGSIVTTSVEGGKDTKKLNLQEGSFKTKAEFIQVAEQALLDSGITRSDKEWDELKNLAYQEYNVKDLPRS